MLLPFWMDTHWRLCSLTDDCSCLSGSIKKRGGLTHADEKKSSRRGPSNSSNSSSVEQTILMVSFWYYWYLDWILAPLGSIFQHFGSDPRFAESSFLFFGCDGNANHESPRCIDSIDSIDPFFPKKCWWVMVGTLITRLEPLTWCCEWAQFEITSMEVSYVQELRCHHINIPFGSGSCQCFRLSELWRCHLPFTFKAACCIRNHPTVEHVFREQC